MRVFGLFMDDIMQVETNNVRLLWNANEKSAITLQSSYLTILSKLYGDMLLLFFYNY